MLKSLAKRSRRENAKNFPFANAIISITSDFIPIAITGNDESNKK